MAYWTDDRHLYVEQKRLDAEQTAPVKPSPEKPEADHVAVLREWRGEWAATLNDRLANPGTRDEATRALAAIDHAIATCEREAVREAELQRLKSVPAVALAAATAKVLADTQAKHAALVARLGEARSLLIEARYDSTELRDMYARPALKSTYQRQIAQINAWLAADDLARVVKGGGE